MLSDDDSDELERMRRREPSALEQLHAGLKTKQFLNRNASSKLSNRIQVFQQERSGQKSVSFQLMKDSVQLMSHKKFILTRFVGHKKTMEHGQRWRLYLEANKNAGCWICQKWTYTLFFWTRPFGENDQIKLSSAQLQDFEEKKRCMELFVPVGSEAKAVAGKAALQSKPSQFLSN